MNPSINEPVQFGPPDLADITLVAEEQGKKQEFKANKAVLANSSDIFKTLFYEVAMDRYEIENVSIVGFRRVLETIYEGKPRDIDNIFTCTVRNVETNKTLTGWRWYEELLRVRELNHMAAFEFEDYTWGLLTVADRLNVLEMVKNCFAKVIKTSSCSAEHCFFCMRKNYYEDFEMIIVEPPPPETDDMILSLKD